MKLQRIVVGIDGSHHAALGLDWAIHLAGACDAEVIAVHAVGLLAHLDDDHTVPASPHRAELEQAFARWCEPLERSEVAHQCLLVDGAAEIVLLDVADEHDADLIVIGSRGIGATPAGQLGSTSLRVAERSRRPVLVAPEPTPTDAQATGGAGG